jgi:Amt family ammonium transporter
MFARCLLIFLFLASPQTANAQVAVADSGDTGWMILCALLVLLAGLPGLLLRHAGLVNVRSVLSVATQGIAVAAGASLAWAVAGYSLAFAPGSSWLGGGANLLLANLATLRQGLTIPESAFVLFQMALGLFAACLLPGATAERARFGWVAGLAPLWLLIVYAPLARAIWGGGWLAEFGAIDFAGSLVIHGSAGFSALALSLIFGRRRPSASSGHAPVLSLAGGALIWIGWAGIVGGWALGATDNAATAILNMHFAACAGALGWLLLDRVITGRVSGPGALSGAVSGLVAISATAPLVSTGGAMLIGLMASVLCRGAKTILNRRIDDTAGVFLLHGVGGVIGALLLPLFVQPMLGGVGFDNDISFRAVMLGQLAGVAVVALWSMIGTAIVALLLSVLLPVRLAAQDSADGLDQVDHGQQGWDFR